MNALNDVSQWYQLGVQLEVEIAQLKKIKSQFCNDLDGLSLMKIEMLYAWLQSNPAASWGNLVAALRRIKLFSVAQDIENKYCLLRFNQIGK